MSKSEERFQRAVIHCRVSSAAQVRNGHGLERRDSRCREYSAAQGYAIDAVSPDHVSGEGDFMARPGMVALFSFPEARPNRTNMVIFDDLKRFAEDTESHAKLRMTLNSVGARSGCRNFLF